MPHMKGTILMLSALLLAGCGEKKDLQGLEKPVVFTSILPQAGLAKAIAGEHAEIRTLVGEGQSPHAYEPTARQLARLGKAETQLLKKITALYPELTLVETQRGIPLIAMGHGAHCDHEEHDHGAADPHIWLNPSNAVAIARAMLQSFEKTDPAHAGEYRNNFEHLSKELMKLDAETRARLIPFKGARFYVFHPSFGYFAEAYGLEQVSIELDGKSPSPRQLADLIAQAREDGVKVVFVQQQFPADSATAVADAIGGSVVRLDPLAEDVVANLRKIAESIAQALEQT
jgi:zinc transport system substrate-binding protein